MYIICGLDSIIFSNGASRTMWDNIYHLATCGNTPWEHGAWCGDRNKISLAERAIPDRYSCACAWTTRTCGKHFTVHTLSVSGATAADAHDDAGHEALICCYTTSNIPILWRPSKLRRIQQLYRTTRTWCPTPRRVVMGSWKTCIQWSHTLFLDTCNVFPPRY